MPDIPVELTDNVISILGLEPEYPDGDPNKVVLKVGDQLWVLFTAVRSYTRGNGFSVDENGVWQIPDDIQSVLVTAYPRYALGYVPGGDTTGPKGLGSFSDIELKILNQYRKVAG